MARIIHSIVVLLFLVAPSQHTSVENYIVLITSVYNYYGTTCIMLVYSDSELEFASLTLLHSWSRAFSRHGIRTLAVSFRSLPARASHFQGHILRPLFVILITSPKTLEEFKSAVHRVNISYPVWFVMYLDDEEISLKTPLKTPLESFCLQPSENYFNLKFDTLMLVLCYDRPELNEWYALSDSETIVFTLANWIAGEEMNVMTRKSLYARRGDMQGEVLRVATVTESAFVLIKDEELTYFFGDVVVELSKLMNFTIKLLHPADSYGGWNERIKAWTGAIGQLAKNEADLGVAEFTMTSQRLAVADFTLPLSQSENRVYFKKPDRFTVKWSSYFEAFDEKTWVVIVLIIIAAPILLTLMKTRGRLAMGIMSESYVSVWGIFCQQGLSEFPVESSLRLAYLSIFVAALIVSATYSASLISFLTVTTGSLPFSTLEEFAEDGSYDFLVFRDSADYYLFANANDNISLKLRKIMRHERELPISLKEAFEKVCTDRVGLYATEAIKNAVSQHLTCEVTFIEAIKADSAALALTKYNQFTGLINYNLQRLKDNGVLKKLKSKYSISVSVSDPKFVPVNLLGVAPILAVVGGGIILGWFILTAERTYYHLVEYKRRREVQLLKKLYKIVGFKSRGERVKRNRRTFRPRRKSNLIPTKLTLGYWP